MQASDPKVNVTKMTVMLSKSEAIMGSLGRNVMDAIEDEKRPSKAKANMSIRVKLATPGLVKTCRPSMAT